MSYGIYQHSDRGSITLTGFVVRETLPGLKLAADRHNYGLQLPVKVYILKAAAQKACDKLNATGDAP